MSYQTHSGTSQPSHPQAHHSNSTDSNVSQQSIDWNNYTYLANTPPTANQNQPQGNNNTNGYKPAPAPSYGNTRQDEYQYGQNMHQPQINYQQSYSSGSSRQPSQQQYAPNPSPSQHHLQPPQHAMQQRSSEGSSAPLNKGKAPANPPPPSSNDPSNPDNGLTLDPAAFSRDIRFQVPQFLSNQVGGAPSFPAGGEAWSGYLGPNFSGDMGGSNLTPGHMFNSVFGIGSTPDGSHFNNTNSDVKEGRNVLEGLSGFMNGDSGWGENWSNMEKDPQDMSNMGTTFYVNPNPSSNILSRNTPSQNNQAKRPNQQPPFRPKSSVPSPQNANTMSTSAILPATSAYQTSLQNDTPSYVPSISAPTTSASTINIASSSTAPYAPPSNTEALLSGPPLPPNLVGPSLTDGPGLYSTTGFDMVGVLARVANRKDPKTVLGPVDLSCSFVVVDVRRYDSPIVYASPTFVSLTGYDLPSILGRNCRFLQAPDGEVVKGSKRKYTDNIAVAHLKRMLNGGKECQASLINYRRGGVPFINLVTVVPIPWDGTDIVYHVGFQVDLVEQPNAILRNMRDGSYQVNYTVGNPPQAPLRPAGREQALGLSQEILEIMGARVNAPGFGHGEDGGKTEWLKMVLENADDFIHVLSLKGLFQYVSPSVRRVLEYEPEDLLNKNIADICHPSDIVPLMRELKDSTHAPSDGQPARPVTLVFRIRRKNSGYVWIESTGRLHVEPGKGRKAVILSGRARSIPTLPWDSVSKHGGLGDHEFWAKISFQGLILHVTESVRKVLGQNVNTIIGQSLFSLLPGGSNGPPSPSSLTSSPSSPSSQLANALNAVILADSRNGGTTTTLKMVQRSGKAVEVDVVIYTPKSTAQISRAGSGSDDDSGDRSDSPNSDDSRPNSTSSATIAGAQPTSLVVQIKLRQTTQPPQQSGPTPYGYTQPLHAQQQQTQPPPSRPIVHAASANLFEELETTRGTSWQYELHQLRLLNRRLKEDISTVKAVVAKNAAKGKSKKRKPEEGAGVPYHMDGQAGLPPNNGNGGNAVNGGGGNGGGGGPGNASSNSAPNATRMGPPPVPEQFKATPRHQLAPGFGFVPPGTSSPYY